MPRPRHFGSEQHDSGTSKIALSHELRSEGVSGASERASGGASGPLLTSRFFCCFKPPCASAEGKCEKYRFNMRFDDHAVTTSGLFLFGYYYGDFKADDIERSLSMKMSNLVIRERLQHLNIGEWFQPYKKGVEKRILTDALVTRLVKNLGAATAGKYISSDQNTVAPSSIHVFFYKIAVFFGQPGLFLNFWSF